MAGSDIKLPIFNGNGLEDPEKHWFLCEVVCNVARISPCYRGRNGSLMLIGHKGRFLLMVNAEKRN